MPRLNKGVVKQGADGLWYGRVRWTDERTGKERDKKFPPVATKTAADKLVEDFKAELKTHGTATVDADRMKFTDLAKTYQEKKLYPAKFVGGRKVGGVKSLAPMLSALNALKDFFGEHKVKAIRHADIEAFKMHRLDTPTKHSGQRTIASVNRELELMRAVMRWAARQGFIIRPPFEQGDSLISKADETRRERTISHDEERRLLEAFDKPRRRHLRPLFIAALDTAARRGELFKLRWRDVNFATSTITIVAENSKTQRPRIIGMTPRLRDELLRLWDESPQDLNGSVFGYDGKHSTMKTAWRSACVEAGIQGLHWHDLRHSAITRMVETKASASLIMKISGHTQHPTFARYVNPTTEAITGIADALARFNAQAQTDTVEVAGLVN